MRNHQLATDLTERTLQRRIILVIEGDRRRPLLDVAELWAFREVALLLAWRSFKASYRQTYLGVTWAVLQPLVAMGVFSVVFGRLVGVPSEGVPYPLFVLSGLIPWNLISRSIGAMTGSIIGDQDLVKRIYFPRVAIPMAALAPALGNMMFGLGILALTLAFFGYAPPPQILLVPLFILHAVALALGVGLMTAALNVRFRDVGFVLPFATQTMLFLTPVIYPATLLPDAWRFVYALNPAVGIIEGFRWSLLGVTPDWPTIAISVVIAIGVLLAGLWFFARSEDAFADHI